MSKDLIEHLRRYCDLPLQSVPRPQNVVKEIKALLKSQKAGYILAAQFLPEFGLSNDMWAVLRYYQKRTLLEIAGMLQWKKRHLAPELSLLLENFPGIGRYRAAFLFTR